MTRIWAQAAFVTASLAFGTAYAQTNDAGTAGQPPAPAGQGLLNRNNITSTGATVPHPGAAAVEDPNPVLMGRSIHDENDRPVQNICKNC